MVVHSKKIGRNRHDLRWWVLKRPNLINSNKIDNAVDHHSCNSWLKRIKPIKTLNKKKVEMI